LSHGPPRYDAGMTRLGLHRRAASTFWASGALVLATTLALACAGQTASPAESRSPEVAATTAPATRTPTGRHRVTPQPTTAATPEQTPSGPPEWTPPPGPPTMLPETTDPERGVTGDDIYRIARDVVGRLFAAYSAGGVGLDDVFTPLGLEGAVAADPLMSAIAAGERQVEGHFEVVGVAEGWTVHSTRYMPDGMPVWIDLSVSVDADPGARILDRDGQLVEEVGEAQRMEYLIVAVWDGANQRWQIDELASPALGTELHRPGGTPATGRPCPWRPDEVPQRDGFDVTNRRVWCDARGLRVPEDNVAFFRGTGHCGWESISFIHLGPEPGWETDDLNIIQFVRDPDGLFKGEYGWLSDFEIGAELPADAVDTGLTNGNVRLFHSPSQYDTAVYAQVGRAIERWPRMREFATCP
jgi:hypothetical protein